jgi:hypothetical protein
MTRAPCTNRVKRYQNIHLLTYFSKIAGLYAWYSPILASRCLLILWKLRAIIKHMNNKNLYYALRIVQRFSLLLMGMATIIYWIVLINLAITNSGAYQVQANIAHLATIESHIISRLSFVALLWTVGTLALTLALGLFAQVRKHEKRLLFDSSIIIVFTLLSIEFSQLVVKNFLAAHLSL